MTVPYYEFVTRWEIAAPRELLYDLLGNPSGYSSWMKSLKIEVTPVRQGDADGVGREDIYKIRAFLPYTLTWKLRCVQARRPDEFLSVATGELEGTGKWCFEPAYPNSLITFEWKVGARKPFLRAFSWLLRPVFQWNHDWVMARWEQDLRREAARRQKGDRTY